MEHRGSDCLVFFKKKQVIALSTRPESGDSWHTHKLKHPMVVDEWDTNSFLGMLVLHESTKKEVSNIIMIGETF
jgi:hypothetical protein